MSDAVSKVYGSCRYGEEEESDRDLRKRSRMQSMHEEGPMRQAHAMSRFELDAVGVLVDVWEGSGELGDSGR